MTIEDPIQFHHDGCNGINLQSQERDLIRRALERYKGNRKQAAEALHISTVTLWRKMKEYQLTT